MNHALRSLLLDVARGEIGPAIQARAQQLLDGDGGRRVKKPFGVGASVAHAEARQAAESLSAKIQRQEVRIAVMERAAGCCEACGARRGEALHMDHFWGRAREESVESCWGLCPSCDDDKTNNRPSRAHWLRRFIAHASLHTYQDQAAKAQRQLAHELAQHPEPLPAAPTPTKEPTPCPF